MSTTVDEDAKSSLFKKKTELGFEICTKTGSAPTREQSECYTHTHGLTDDIKPSEKRL